MQKLLLLALLLCFGLIADAQPHVRVAPKNNKSKSVLNPDVFDTTSLKCLNQNNYIANLKQDKMPCLIPLPWDKSIPNAFGGGVYGNIPNVWKRQKETIRRKPDNRRR